MKQISSARIGDERKRSRLRSIFKWGGIASAALVGLCLLLLVALATGVIGITLPLLSGQCKIGKITYTLTDSSRKESFVSAGNTPRSFAITIYYPAAVPAGARPAPYIDNPKVASVLAGRLHIPPFLANIVHSHSYANVPAANGTYPLVFFSPGIGNAVSEYTSEVEDLASHGYVVVALYHTYSVAATPLPNGAVAAANDAGMKSENEPDGTSDQQTDQDRNVIGTVWTKDIEFAFDKMAQLNGTDPTLKGHIDLQRTGIYGHSFGGAATAEMLSVDPRFKAGINMDGETFAMTDPSKIKQPFLWMASDYSQVTDAQISRLGMTRQEFDAKVKKKVDERTRFLNQVGSNAKLFILSGSTHNTFAADDAIVGKVIPGLSDPLASINPTQATQTINAHINTFFDNYLKR